MKTIKPPLFLVSQAIALIMLACGISFDLGQATPVPSEIPTETSLPTTTPVPTETPTPTATPDYIATQRAEDMLTLAERMVKDGYLDSAAGQVVFLPDQTGASTIENGGAAYIWTTQTQLADFILKVDLTWETAADNAMYSGCGFAIRRQPNDNHYLIFLSVDGYLMGVLYNFGRITSSLPVGHWPSMGRGYWGPQMLDGQATMVILAEKNQFRVFVNDDFIKTFTGYEYSMLDGTISYAVIPSNHVDFGTRCTFTNGALWLLEP